MPEADHLSAQSTEIISMDSQGFAGAGEGQLVNQEDLEEIDDDFPPSEIFGLDTPSAGPVIDVQIVFLEPRRGFSVYRRSQFSGSGHFDSVADLPVTELPLEVASEGIDPDALDGLSVAMQDIELAPALGIAEVSPVGSLITGAGKARLLDEGFEQDGPIGVAGLPVIGQPAAHQGEDARGEVLALDPRQDEEAGIVHDEVQVALPLICRPTNELVPGFDLPGARAEAQSGDDVAGADRVQEWQRRQYSYRHRRRTGRRALAPLPGRTQEWSGGHRDDHRQCRLPRDPAWRQTTQLRRRQCRAGLSGARGGETHRPTHGGLRPCQLGQATRASARGMLWNAYIERHHYLRHQPMPGAQLRYFVRAGSSTACSMCA